MTELLKYTAYLIFCALVAVVLILFLKCVIYSKFIGLSAINPRRLPATSKNEANKSPILKYSEMPNSKIKNRSSYSKQEETAVKPQKKTPKKQKASSLGKKEEKSLIEQSTVPHQKQEKALRREQTEKMPSDEQKSEQIPQINVKQLPEFIVPEDPKRLEDFGVTFQNDELKSIATGKKFALRLTQRQYELLGDFVLLWIQKEMKNRYNFQEVWIPLCDESSSPEARNNIFVSQNWKESKKLMVFIQGSGAVRPGVWARSLCINDSLRTGSMFPYFDKALAEDYGIIVLNPNLNVVSIEIWRVPIRGSESPQRHTLYVWDHFIMQSQAKDVVIVAHSFGGVCAMHLLKHRYEDVVSRVRAIALTDSVHFFSTAELDTNRKIFDFLQESCINWVASSEPLDTPIQDDNFYRISGCPLRSAGHSVHEYTSASAINSVFVFFKEKCRQTVKTKHDDNANRPKL